MATKNPRSVSNGTMTLAEYHARQALLSKSFFTIKGLMKAAGLARTSVQSAIDKGKVIAVKLDAEEGATGGVWIIEAKSARQLWSARFTQKENE